MDFVSSEARGKNKKEITNAFLGQFSGEKKKNNRRKQEHETLKDILVFRNRPWDF